MQLARCTAVCSAERSGRLRAGALRGRASDALPLGLASHVCVALCCWDCRRKCGTGRLRWRCVIGSCGESVALLTLCRWDWRRKCLAGRMCRWELRGVCRTGDAVPLGVAGSLSRWQRYAVGVCDKSVSLDAASGAAPLRIAGRVSHWWRCADGICDKTIGEERGKDRRREKRAERRGEERRARRKEKGARGGDRSGERTGQKRVLFSCHVMSRRVMSCHVMSRHVMSRRVVSCHVMSLRVVSGRVFFWRPVWYVFSWPVRSCRVVSVSVSSCRLRFLASMSSLLESRLFFSRYITRCHSIFNAIEGR